MLGDSVGVSAVDSVVPVVNHPFLVGEVVVVFGS